MDAVAKLKPPQFPLPQLEPGRALTELSTLPLARLLVRFAPRGDGHPVLTLPGFLGGDRSTGLIRRYLRGRGYSMHPWTLGQNLGPRAIGDDGELLADRILDIYRETRRKVSLVGWSLGGIMAREIAKEMPDQIRQVITLGSPFGGGPEASNVGKLYRRVTGHEVESPEVQARIRELGAPPPKVPSTAIFSKTDGVVHWRACIERPAPLTDNIEVYASHCGLGVNPIVMFALAERLAVPETDWRPFDRHAQAWRQLAFPSSGHSYGYAGESSSKARSSAAGSRQGANGGKLNGVHRTGPHAIDLSRPSQ